MGKKKALVTGAGIGIGKGIAEELVRSGYDVAIHYNSTKDGAEKVANIGACSGVEAFTVQADLSDHNELVGMFETIRSKFDHLDLVVCNAGVTVSESFLKMDLEKFNFLNGVDWHGTFFTAQLAANYMVETNTAGHIIIISSNQGHSVFPMGAAYGSVKAALSQFAKYISIELAPYGIRVNEIAPGWTWTPRLDGMQELSYPMIPMKRWSTPQEIGKAVLYLDSEWSKSITGACLVIDGGAHNYNATAVLFKEFVEKYRNKKNK